MSGSKAKIYFSDFFNVEHDLIESYGALDIALVCDNPAFIDPFLIFANPAYSEQHSFIIAYISFLRKLAREMGGIKLDNATFRYYYKFPEVKEAWLGYSVASNGGAGLGKDFADSLYKNLNKIFTKFGEESITTTSHLEKLCLVEEGVGVDKISDFTANLIKNYLLEYTQKFALANIDKKHLKEFAVNKTKFDFSSRMWSGGKFVLPCLSEGGKDQFVLLVPRDILVKDATWISRSDFLKKDTSIFSSIQNDELRLKINRFFHDNLDDIYTEEGPVKDERQKSRNKSMRRTVAEFPEIIDYYIKLKEDEKDEAIKNNLEEADQINFFSDINDIWSQLEAKKFKNITAIGDCVERILFFKQVLESNSGSLYLTTVSLKEKQLQLMFKMATYDSLFDYNSEVNNGRGPIDFIVSFGANEKIGIEFKLASSSKLKQNLQNQGKVYQDDSNLKHVIKVIFYFSDEELDRIRDVLNDLRKKEDDYEIFLIDCRKKESASNVKSA